MASLIFVPASSSGPARESQICASNQSQILVSRLQFPQATASIRVQPKPAFLPLGSFPTPLGALGFVQMQVTAADLLAIASPE